MRAPLSWIRKHVPLSAEVTGREVAARLIAAGLEVETVDTIGGDVTGPLVVGRVRTVEELTGFRKPIRFCRVEVGAGNGEQVNGHAGHDGAGNGGAGDGGAGDDGAGDDGAGNGEAGDERGIICGARNFAAGDLVVVALPGATLPGGFQIASRPTYGRTSDGMIASERELGIGEDHAGIIVLPPGAAEPGESGYEVLGIGDEVLDIAVTPDRGYALSIRGVAREVATAFGLPFDDPADLDPAVILPTAKATGRPAPGTSSATGTSTAETDSDLEPHPCSITDPDTADRFVLRTLTGLDPQAATPQWMRRALVACGMRPVSLAVDVTNYVMLELGQPLHAFDRATLSGTLTVRHARPGETLETLDHVKRTLRPADVVIADERGPLALAGTMGGVNSEIGESSRDVAIEAVHFDATGIARMSRHHKLSSEASRRFERGVDPALPPIASARAAALLIELGGARYVGQTEVDSRGDVAAIDLEAQRPASVAGMPIAGERVASRLREVGADVAETGDGMLRVTPPTWRPDLLAPADLVEEVVRLEGYDTIPATLPRARAGYGLTAGQRLRRRVGRSLAGEGLVEVLTYPFIGQGELSALGMAADDERMHLIRLANPLSDEQPFLRTTLLPGLIATARRNLSRGASDVAIFEAGLVFRAPAGAPQAEAVRPSVAGPPTTAQLEAIAALLPQQPRLVAGLLCGERDRAGWWGSGRSADWSDALGIVQALAEELSVDLEVAAGSAAPWHPGRCAQLRVAGTGIGHVGEVHPRTLENAGLPARTVAFELDLDALAGAAPDAVSAPVLSAMPVAKEDLAVVVDERVTAGQVQAALAAGAGVLLESVRLFDTYSGDQVPPGKKSLAFALRFRAPDRTLSSAEVADLRQAALAAAQAGCGAVLRT